MKEEEGSPATEDAVVDASGSAKTKSRRKFLKAATKVSVYTPAVMAVVSTPSLARIARSNGTVLQKKTSRKKATKKKATKKKVSKKRSVRRNPD